MVDGGSITDMFDAALLDEGEPPTEDLPLVEFPVASTQRPRRRKAWLQMMAESSTESPVKKAKVADESREQRAEKDEKPSAVETTAIVIANVPGELRAQCSESSSNGSFRIGGSSFVSSCLSVTP